MRETAAAGMTAIYRYCPEKESLFEAAFPLAGQGPRPSASA